jgi:hypothetical protein
MIGAKNTRSPVAVPKASTMTVAKRGRNRRVDKRRMLRCGKITVCYIH